LRQHEPPAFIENHAVGQSPSRISMKLRGCQQSQMSFSLLLSLCYTTPRFAFHLYSEESSA
jgi:hypothetical protein